MSEEIEPANPNDTAQAGMLTAPGKPIEVADIEDEILATTQPEVAAQGRRFFFGNVTLHKFKDGTQYHVRKHHALVTDPQIVANLIDASKDPNLKIFPAE